MGRRLFSDDSATTFVPGRVDRARIGVVVLSGNSEAQEVYVWRGSKPRLRRRALSNRSSFVSSSENTGRCHSQIEWDSVACRR
jgi:hypothetical protein